MVDFLQMQQASEVDRKMSLLRLVQNAEPEQSMADFTRDGPPYVSPNVGLQAAGLASTAVACLLHFPDMPCISLI